MNMKTYIKPNTDLHKLELSQLIAATTPQTPIQNNDAGKDGNGDYGDAKTHGFGTNSLWDLDEEE